MQGRRMIIKVVDHMFEVPHCKRFVDSFEKSQHFLSWECLRIFSVCQEDLHPHLGIAQKWPSRKLKYKIYELWRQALEIPHCSCRAIKLAVQHIPIVNLIFA